MEKPCVLIVEGQNELASMLAEMAAISDFSVTSVSNATHLRKVLVEHTFDIIIINLFMPEPDRFKLIIDLADICCKSPLIFISSEGSMALDVAGKIARTKKLNLIASLNKPIQPEALSEILNKAI